MRMRAGTQKVRNTENDPRTFPSMLPACGQKNRNDGGELSRQWNTQPARPTTGSPQAHPHNRPHIPTHTSGAKGNRRAHKKAPRTGANPGARHHSLSKKQLTRQLLVVDVRHVNILVDLAFLQLLAVLHRLGPHACNTLGL